jgi:hypothetical protein
MTYVRYPGTPGIPRPESPNELDRFCVGFQLPATAIFHALCWPAAEKRQSTKSRRWVVRGQCCGLWGFSGGLSCGEGLRGAAAAIGLLRVFVNTSARLVAAWPRGGWCDAKGRIERRIMTGSVAGDRAARLMPATGVLDLFHEVSILIFCGAGVGRYFGSHPRAKISMTIMRPPQQGHGTGSTCCSSVATGSGG